MDYIYSSFFGIIQGATEFLPVSSSGHLVIMHKLIKLPVSSELAFDVFMHLATLLAVLIYFYKDIISIFKSWLISINGPKSDLSRLGWFIIIATIPAFMLAWLFSDIIETVLRSPFVVAAMLIIIGALFIYVEKIKRGDYDLNNLNWRKSIFLGLAQSVALIPGTSRSGITIIAGLWLGLKREAAVKFSFLLAIPVILASTIKEAPNILAWQSGKELAIIATAFIFSFLSGYFSIRFFLKYVKNHDLRYFAYYRFLLAIIVIFYFLAR